MVKNRSTAHQLRKICIWARGVSFGLLCLGAILTGGCGNIVPDTSPNPAAQKTTLVLNEQENGLRRCVWPPPDPSGMYTFSRMQIQRHPVADLYDVNYYLTQAIKMAGYSDFCYYAVPGTGFAIFTPMEEIDGKGNRIDSGATNAPVYPGTLASITKYFEHLFLPVPKEEKHYRAFAFYVTPLQWPDTSIYTLTKHEFDTWTKSGGRPLPPLFNKIKASNYHCYVAVYELTAKPYTKPVENEFDSGGPNECRDQLQKAGMWQKLAFDK
jgi:hypothetical protein